MLDQVQLTKPVEARAPRSAEDMPWCEKHHQIVRDEIEAINTRREETRQIPTDGLQSCQMLDVTGLALSGGGIRSSALCLGVLQALNHHNLFRRIDYLSTVSGGGYIGTSLSATMTVARRFVFGERPSGGTATANEISDTASVGHIRNYSNYLIPAGVRDLLTGIAIVVRGLIANIGIILPIILMLAAVTIWSTPTRTCLTVANLFGVSFVDSKTCELHDFSFVNLHGFWLVGVICAAVLLAFSVLAYFGARSERGSGPAIVWIYAAVVVLVVGVACDLARVLQVKNFALTLATAIIVFVLFFAWAIVRSFAGPSKRQEFRSHLPTVGATFLVLLAGIAFFEFQPFMLRQMFDVADSSVIGGPVGGVAVTWLQSLAAVAAPVGVFVTAFRQQFLELLKGNSVSSQWGSVLLAIAAKAALWIAGLALPLIIWVAYLNLSYWGISNDIFKNCSAQTEQRDCIAKAKLTATLPGALAGKVQLDRNAAIEFAEAKPAPPPESLVGMDSDRLATWHAPAWLQPAAQWLKPKVQPYFPDLFTGTGSDAAYSYTLPVIVLYALTGLLLFLVSWLLTPNANSLHRLYRDRLSKAFLFDPTRTAESDLARAEASLDQGRDFKPLDRMKLSDLYGVSYGVPAAAADGQQIGARLLAPYHLINTALNIQGSDFANRRGRNADFFVFSPRNVGSEATGYAATLAVEKAEQSLDLATAMAISGAAASANMGSNSIRALTPTLALLNVRLGYWLRNPRYVNGQWFRRFSPRYFWSEISGRLYENSEGVYLTDGGHIENLGIYELLRRRCRVIIAVDAEADTPMNFAALMTLQRYARIDLGVRIDLPWAPIRERTRAVMACNANPATAKSQRDDKPVDHVHVAIGTIDYGAGDTGYLVYLKSSLTGDENDYIRDYGRRHATFPHETTGDQFFSEEQFEVYRALGFHMAHGFLSGTNPVAIGCGVEPRTARFNEAGEPAIDAVREALGLPIPQLRAAAVTATMIDQG